MTPREPLRVLLFTSIFPTPDVPGRGVFSAHRFGALSDLCETRLVVPLPWWIARRSIGLTRPHRATVHGIATDYTTYWSLPRVAVLHARAMAMSVEPWIRRLRRDFPFDAILAAWAYPDAAAAAIVARRLGCPLVSMVLGSDVNEIARRPGLRAQTSWGLRRSSRVVAVSAALRQRVIEDLGVDAGRVLVQHNGVDGERFTLRRKQDARRKLGLRDDRRIVCYVGNLVGEKGVDLLPAAMRELKSYGVDNAQLMIVGSGPLESQMRAAGEAYGLGDALVFQGRKPYGEIPDWISACDVLVLPSRREGCPNVVLEALASGRPVVGARVGGVPELLTERTGISVTPDDPAALADGLRTALSRSWEPVTLRGSVQSLSWGDYGRLLRSAVEAAVEEHSGSYQHGDLELTA